VSCTGKGEVFLQHVAAHSLSSRVALGHMSLQEASQDVVHNMLPVDSGGLIAIDSKGHVVMDFNSKGMLRLECDETGRGRVAIWEDTVAVTAV
jgi:L-asparaginase / beta-aspartyl-peptidase